MSRFGWLVLAAFVASPAMAHVGEARVLATGGAPEISALRIVLALVFCLGIAAGLALFVRSRGSLFSSANSAGGRRLWRHSRIDVLETRRLSSHADLCLVRFDAREYLVACGTGAILVIEQSAVEDPVAPGQATHA